ncbi:MAG: DUF2829 domain-containing protein [Bacteroidales bacterium]|nr:DUF2829 domain-containing protein [Bacteroidales bacterium]MBN2749945.1 DUF2829 domain-containing protein [Bacteroidales bacterium]
MENLSFGEALEAAKKGGRIARQGWNGKGMFVFMRPADELHIDMVIDKVKSLPQSVKDYYLKDVLNGNGERVYPADEDDKVKFTAYLCLKAADGTIVNGWQPSQLDMLTNDWTILPFSKEQIEIEEEQAKELGWEFVKQYNQEEFLVTCYKLGCMEIEFNYVNEEMVFCELNILSLMCMPIDFEQLKVLTEMLGWWTMDFNPNRQ